MDSFENYKSMAESYFGDKKYDDALKTYDKAIACAPDEDTKEFLRAERQKVSLASIRDAG